MDGKKSNLPPWISSSLESPPWAVITLQMEVHDGEFRGMADGLGMREIGEEKILEERLGVWVVCWVWRKSLSV